MLSRIVQENTEGVFDIIQKNTFDIFHEARLYLQQNTDYPLQECDSLIAYLLEWHFQMKRIDVLAKKNFETTPEKWELWQFWVGKLANYVPIQHLVGEVSFLGKTFQVSPDVLIPRHETEEWTHQLIEFCQDLAYLPTAILDVCTGSGCIAISLVSAFPQARTHAWDISLPALYVAQQNAQQASVNIDFQQVDILNTLPTLPTGEWLLVSNPPYIPTQERAIMQRNVVDYEPAIALFVPDESPLIFYERLAYLAEIGKPAMFAVEIHEDFGEQVKALFLKAGFENTSIKQDFHGKSRWVMGCL
jgi:release factor glutamine methyltransferase